MNSLKGKIKEIHSSAMISLITIDVEGDIFSSIILEGAKNGLQYKEGDSVNVIFKESEVGIAKKLSGQISFRNRFIGQIKKVEISEVLTKIVLDYKGKTIESIISTRSAEEMKLQENDKIEWLVKTNEVSLMILS